MIQDAAAVSLDSVRAVLGDVFQDPAYDWNEQTSPFAFLAELLSTVVDWLEGVRELHPALYWLILGVMTGLLIAVIVHVAVLIWLALKPRAVPLAVTGRTPPARRDARWHLDESRRLRAAGQFTESLAHRFTALLLQLERRNALTYDPTKTPREYTDEARLDDSGRSVLNELVASLYRHLFGGEPCTEEDLDRFDLAAAQLGDRVAA